MAQTFVLLKPDAMERGLAGEIIARFERKGLKITAAKIIQIDPELSKKHYSEHVEKGFYPDLEAFICRSPCLALTLGFSEDTSLGDSSGAMDAASIVNIVRDMMGPTNPLEAPPGSIRGDFGIQITENLVHGSDSPASAEREIDLFFNSA